MLNGCFVNPSSATKLVGGVQVKATPGPAACFLRKPHLGGCAPPPAVSPLPSLPPEWRGWTAPPLRPSPPVTAGGRCVRVELALCGPSVWSPSAERLLTGWMGGSTTVYVASDAGTEPRAPPKPAPLPQLHPSQLGCSLLRRRLPVWSPGSEMMALPSAAGFCFHCVKICGLGEVSFEVELGS